VDLLLNGESVGVKKSEDFPAGTIYWDIPYSKGTLKAVGIRNGNISCTHELKTADKPAKLQLHSDTITLKADKEDVAHIEVNILDQDNNLVYSAENEIHCSIVGPGEIIGIECSNPVSHQDYKANYRKAFHGKLLIYVKATDQVGTIIVKTSSEDLEGCAVVIDVK
jgi:hypothetical protein